MAKLNPKEAYASALESVGGRKFVAFLITQVFVAVLIWLGKADAWLLAANLGAIVGAQGIVDVSATSPKGYSPILAAIGGRKFVAFLITQIFVAVLVWLGKADSWLLAADLGAMVGAQGLVDLAAARRGAAEKKSAGLTSP